MKTSQIIVDPNILAGHPIVKGTRIPVSLILNLLSHGYTFEKIIAEYPELSKTDIQHAIIYAQQRIEREETISA